MLQRNEEFNKLKVREEQINFSKRCNYSKRCSPQHLK